MIKNLKHTGHWCLDPLLYSRKSVIDYIQTQKQFNPNFKVVDVGGYGSPWSKPYIDAIIDLNRVDDNRYIQFNGNICENEIWFNVMEYVIKHGKFDFSICTHTLEDIAAPTFVCGWLEKISKEGFIAMPSKYEECKRGESTQPYPQYKGLPYRGYYHHHWIFNPENGNVVAYPKLPVTEYMSALDEVGSKCILQKNDELQWFWEKETNLKIVNNGFFWTLEEFKTLYNRLLID
jgi:hypothetical protein